MVCYSQTAALQYAARDRINEVYSNSSTNINDGRVAVTSQPQQAHQVPRHHSVSPQPSHPQYNFEHRDNYQLDLEDQEHIGPQTSVPQYHRDNYQHHHQDQEHIGPQTSVPQYNRDNYQQHHQDQENRVSGLPPPLDSRLSQTAVVGSAVENLEEEEDSSRGRAAMLVTELPSLLGCHSHDHNHNRSLSDKDCDDMDSHREQFMFPQNFKNQLAYNSIDRKPKKQSKGPTTHTLNKTFPNGFPNFNHFRNNPQGFYDNFCYDAGYSSEKSPEEEELPALFDIETLDSSRDETKTPESGDIGGHSQAEEDDDDDEEPEHSIIQQLVMKEVEFSTQTLIDLYPFINEGTIFDVIVEKNSRGLGLSLSCGIEVKSRYAGLLRIKRLFPQMPAWLCGQLELGDIVLEANEVQLSGLTSHEALEVIRTTKTSGVHLLVCRPPAGTIDPMPPSPVPNMSSPGGGDGIGISANTSGALDIPSPSPYHLAPSPVQSVCGEFEISLTKVKGSLGFTLRKRDNSVLGHTIRTLVREPAISDGRIKPGDKILSVNSMDLCGMSHEEAIAFLRTTPETVTIRLYRDVTQTPVSPLSPSESEVNILKPKPLRQEAMDMLSDLAFRKRSSPSMSPSISGGHSASPGNPRRRRLQKTPTPDTARTGVTNRFDSLVRKIEDTPEGSAAEEHPTLSVNLMTGHDASPFSNRDSCASSTSRESALVSRNTSNASTDTNSLSESSDCRRKRPDFLDLDNRQSCSRKTQFTPPHEEQYSFPSPLSSNDNQFHSIGSVDSAPNLGSTQSVSPSFAHTQPAYQSVNFGNIQYQNNEHGRLKETASDYTISSYMNANKTPEQKSGLLKWKGMMLPSDEEENNHGADSNTGRTTVGSDNQNEWSHRMKEVTMTLQRGWNSRLGFSLQSDGQATKVVAIYSGCVAAKDGRLKIGDEILKVNDEDVRSWETERVIDMLRKTHGKIELKVLQQPF